MEGDDIPVWVTQAGVCTAIGFNVWRLFELSAGGLQARDGWDDVGAKEREKMVGGGEILVEPEIAAAACKDCGTRAALANRRKAKLRVEIDGCLKVGDSENKLEKSKGCSWGNSGAHARTWRLP